MTTCFTGFSWEITLNEQEFNTDTADSNGSLWYISELSGWDSPALRQSFGNPTSRHGAVVLESMLDSRALTATGTCQANSQENYWLSYNSILGTINNLVTSVDLVVYETVPKRIGVIRGGPVRLAHLGLYIFSFELPLLALDPLKYSV